MPAIIAMQRSTDIADRPSARAGKPGFIERTREVLTICWRAADAAHTYEHLKRLSDQELAKRGLKRTDLPRAAFDKLTD